MLLKSSVFNNNKKNIKLKIKNGKFKIKIPTTKLHLKFKTWGKITEKMSKRRLNSLDLRKQKNSSETVGMWDCNSSIFWNSQRMHTVAPNSKQESFLFWSSYCGIQSNAHFSKLSYRSERKIVKMERLGVTTIEWHLLNLFRMREIFSSLHFLQSLFDWLNWNERVFSLIDSSKSEEVWSRRFSSRIRSVFVEFFYQKKNVVRSYSLQHSERKLKGINLTKQKLGKITAFLVGRSGRGRLCVCVK